MKRVNFLLCIFCILTLVSCQKANVVTTSTTGQSVGPSTLAPYVFKTSQPGAITVHGKLIVMNPMAWLPDSNDAVFLVPIPSDEQAITTIPEFKVGEVPRAEVDESTGEFMFTNIEPGQYAVVVLEKSGRQIPVRLLENDSSAIIVLEETDRDQTIELGYLRFP